jgi:hypothetical protein
MTEVRKRSKLPGELGESVDRALIPGDDIIYEIKTYRGHGLVVTHQHLLLVVGGVLAGLKAHEQHIHRLAYDEIVSIDIVPEKPGCFWVFGLPQLDLNITTVDPAKQDPRWTTITVDFMMLSAAVKLACQVHERIGRRKQEDALTEAARQSAIEHGTA